MAESTAPEINAMALIAPGAFLCLTAHGLRGARWNEERQNEIGDAK